MDIPSQDRRRWALEAGVASAVALALVLWDSRFHVVVSGTTTWRGISDPPGLLRIALAVLAGVAFAWATRRAPARWRTPLLLLALAGAPLVPVYTGHGLALLAIQGPVLSLVAGAAFGLAAARAMAVGDPGPVPACLLFAAAFAFYAALMARIPGPAGPQGDEPHYLVMAHSLWTDGDLDLTDEFARQEYSAFFPGRLEPHPSPSTPAGRLYSLHSPGLPLLILPGYALGGLRGAQLVMAAMAALAGVLLHRVVLAAAGAPAAAVAWALFAFTPPLPIYAVSVYPELPAALGTAVLLWTARGTPGWRRCLLAGLAAGAMPWLHSKFLPLGAAGLLFTLLRPVSWRVRALATAVFLALVVGLLAYFHTTYGSARLSAAFGPPDIDLGRVPWGAAAMLLDRQFGLLTCAPAWLLAAPGLVWLLRRRTGDALRAGILIAIPVVVGGAFTMWWAGSSPPARFLLPALPAIALAAAPAARGRKDAAAALGACGLVLVGLAADAPRILHNRPDGESLLLRNLAPAVDLDGLLPSFFERDTRTVVLAVTLAAAAALAWRLRGKGLLAGVAAYALVAGALRDRPLIDQRVATEEVIDRWDPGTWSGPMGPPALRALAIPIELQKGPWVLAAGEQRNSRRTGLPPGAYRVVLEATPVEAGPFRMVVDLYAAELRLGEAVLTDAQPSVSLALLLPGGLRQVGLTAIGEAGRARLDDARVLPEALIPRQVRGEFPYPMFPLADRYRVGGPVVRATAVDRSAPEDGGFRLAGPNGLFLVDGPPAVAVRVEIRRGAPRAGDEVRWFGRAVPLDTREPASSLVLPLSAGQDLGRASVVPVEVRAAGAWVRFSAATGAP